MNAEDLASYFGATKTTISYKIGDEHNPDYKHIIYWKYLTWLYIAQSENLQIVDKENLKAIKKQFGPFGISDDTRKFPMKIHLEWLEQFNFYTPSS